MHDLSADQELALSKLLEWWKIDKGLDSYITLGGYAGTGKTTLIAILRQEIQKISPNIKVGFASYTGKAARVLQSKLQAANVILKGDTVGTIHSLIYIPVVNDHQEITGWKQKEKLEHDLIIIDEASMVDSSIWSHLSSYDKPVIAVGDHGQLPPIHGSFNLMQKPVIMLNKIHRQAEKNPIITLSIQARETGIIRVGQYSDTVVKFNPEEAETRERMQEMLSNYTTDTLILCGYNNTRKKLNSFIRNSLGFDSPEPMRGERIICLRNNHKEKIFNGMQGTIADIRPKSEDWYKADIEMDGQDFPFSGLISKKQFNADSALNFTADRKHTMEGDLFDFGYALTVHKAQGSQAKKVILFEERFKKMDDEQWRRWLYTAVTRAEEELYIFPS